MNPNEQSRFADAKSNGEIEPCLSVLVPVYNEEATIIPVLQRVLQQRPVQELIVVDDASRDKTWEQLQQFGRTEPRLKLFRHECNQGKGAALRTAIQHATAPIVIIQDADFEYDPSEYYVLLPPFSAARPTSSLVRVSGSSAHRVLYFWHSVGNKMLTTFSNMATNLNLTDMETCYKMFKREVLQRLPSRKAGSVSSRRSPPRSAG